jgi:4-amino-4-deoxy-L-arabinose transferase-like glycosyltransferase
VRRGSNTSRSWTLAGGGLLPIIVLAACCLAILLGPAGDVTSEAYDQNQHHMLVIESFAQQWPTPDLRDYRSATAPLWHLVQSIPAALGVPLVGLRILAAVAGAALVLLVARVAARLGGDARLAWLAVPAAMSPYLLSGSIWITTDVPATLALAAALAAAMFARPGSSWLLALGAAIRQTGLWMVPPIALMQWFGAPQGTSTMERVRGAIAAVLPAIVLVGALVWMWGGLTPPGYRDQHDRGVNLAVPAFTLALIALIGVPLVTMRGARELLAMPRIVPCCVAGLGLLVAAAVPTDYDIEAGRWGGPLWTVIRQSPVVADRSLALLVLAPIGALALLVLVKRAHEATRQGSGLALGTAVLCLMTVNTANSQCWERYADLPLLVLLPWLAAIGVRGHDERERRAVVVGGVVLGLVQAGLSVPMVLLPLAGSAQAVAP